MSSVRLANERHENYAKQRARGMSPAKAGVAAGFAAGSSTIAELEKDPEVMSRVQTLIEELQNKRDANRAAAIEAAKVVGQMTGVTKSWVIQKLAENAQMAAEEADFKAANEALKLIGDEFGMFKGGSAGDEREEDQIATMNLDAIEAALGAPGDNARPINTIAAPSVDQVMEAVEPFEPSEAALGLIAGQSDSRRRRDREKIARERQLETGSETDVAMTPEAEPDMIDPEYDAFTAEPDMTAPEPDESTAEAPPKPALTRAERANLRDAAKRVTADKPRDGWRMIDPKTPVDDLIADIKGEIVLPEYVPDDAFTDTPELDDAPPRRSGQRPVTRK